MSEQAEKIFNALVDNNTDAANQAFDSAIKDKIQTVMDVKKVQVTSQIFNSNEQE